MQSMDRIRTNLAPLHGVSGRALGRGSGFVGAPPPARQTVPLPAVSAFGGGGEAASGGLGLFFFGIAGLLVFSSLAVLGMSWALGATMRLPSPQPFICLLERPG
jgi:hypothetical protein